MARRLQAEEYAGGATYVQPAANALLRRPPFFGVAADQSHVYNGSEDIEKWLSRTRPSVTRGSDWIWVHSPSRRGGETQDLSPSAKEECEKALKRVICKNQGGPKRVTQPEKDLVAEEILQAAISCGYVSGKWMLRVSEEEVDEVWGKIARETHLSRLGTTAKVAAPTAGQTTDGGGRATADDYRLICIYTRDFDDLEDCRRVLKAIDRLGLFFKLAGYKPDVYTTLGIYSTTHRMPVTIHNYMVKNRKAAFASSSRPHPENGADSDNNDDAQKRTKR